MDRKTINTLTTTLKKIECEKCKIKFVWLKSQAISKLKEEIKKLKDENKRLKKQNDFLYNKLLIKEGQVTRRPYHSNTDKHPQKINRSKFELW